jgi:UDP-2-acetamido-3-amino-2,3-dideoxy-glucuronate N-acetyltransferase
VVELIKTKHVGLLILTASSLSMLAYTLGIFYATTLVLQLTALAAVLGILGLLTWLGYTMFTEPPSPEVSNPLELDDLRPETINPTGENQSSLRQPEPEFSKIVEAEIGEGTVVRDHVNLYKCKIGRNCKIESFVYVEEGVIVGDDCKIKPHVYIPSGVIIEDQVFLGPNVTFTNDKYPHVRGDWKLLKTIVGHGASIGGHTVILPGVRIGKKATVGAGSVVTRDVPEGATVCGNPARPLVK